jgi:hypothetical protein
MAKALSVVDNYGSYVLFFLLAWLYDTVVCVGIRASSLVSHTILSPRWFTALLTSDFDSLWCPTSSEGTVYPMSC